MNKKTDKFSNVIQLTDQSSVNTTPKIVAYRDERIQISDNTETLAILTSENNESYKFKIKDISTFGARLFSEETDLAFKLNQNFTFEFSIQSTFILKGTAIITNELPCTNGNSYGVSFTNQFVDLDRVRAIITNNSIKEKFNSSSELFNLLREVKPEFKILVADLNSFFQDLKVKLELEEKLIEKKSISESHRKRTEEHILELAVNLNMQSITNLFGQFQEIVNNFTAEEHALHKRYFRLNFNNLIYQTPFLKRAFEKPLGYAGDYGLMIMFYEYKDEGVSIFDKFMHRLSCNQPIAIANKNRVFYLSEIMQSSFKKNKEKKLKISSIACGPAQEVKLFLENTPLKKEDCIDVVLLDQEGEALNYAIKNLKETGNPKCNFKLKALKEDAVLGVIKKKDFTIELEQSDIIICAGLFDYLSDRVASKMIERFYQFLKPGGHIYIGNVSNENPNQFSMDYFMEWNLMVRSHSQMIDLIPASIKTNRDVKFDVVSESLGLNLFLKIEKPTTHE